MIKLKDHMTLKFSVGDFDDFISTPNFYGMEIKENAGGLRPVLNIRFGVLDDVPHFEPIYHTVNGISSKQLNQIILSCLDNV